MPKGQKPRKRKPVSPQKGDMRNLFNSKMEFINKKIDFIQKAQNKRKK